MFFKHLTSKKRSNILLLCLLTLMISGIVLSGCSTQDTGSSAFNITSIDQINGKDMGCMSGSIFDKTIESKFPDSNIIYYGSRSDMLLGLSSGKIAGFVSDKPVGMMMATQDSSISYLDDPIGFVEYGLCFSDNRIDVRDQFNEYLNKITQDGHLKELQDKWISPKCNSQKKTEYTLTGENGVLKCCTTPDAAPFSFISSNEFQGYEVELLFEFANEYGYDVQIDTLTFDALLTAVSTDKYDLALNGIFVTPERAKSVNFCQPHYRGDVVVMIATTDTTGSKSVIETFINNFYRDFIEEDRYLLLLQGFLVTVEISVASLILGTLLAFVEFFLSRRFKLWKKVFDVMEKILGGLPITIVLMLFFYVVFNKSKLTGTLVSIVCFTFLFSSVCYGLLKSGVEAIDNGQMEGALALGYSNPKSMVRVVLPQAIKIMLPSYEKEIISMIKNTSVVGYVSVNDLTRMSDIIRGRTYDALLPLIVVALVYFGFSAFMVRIVDCGLKKLYNRGEEE